MEHDLMSMICQMLLMGCLILIAPIIHAKEGDDNLINISPRAQRAAGIKVEPLKLKSLPVYIRSPGEVIPNTNRTSIVTPRIRAQVVKRLVQMGDFVEKGDALVRLSSVDMAKAQANLLLSKKEWKRVKSLGSRAVSAKRYQTVEVAYQQAYSRLLAYGMTRQQIEALIKSNNLNNSNGDFTLLAPRSGTIFSADFVEGQMIEPGKVLYKIVNETRLWVDAKLSNGESLVIKKGARAIVKTAHDTFSSEVLRVHHKLDETTRTRIVRLKVPNPRDKLHPGEFVTCLIEQSQLPPTLAVNETAIVQMSDGDFAIYIEVKPNFFQAKEIKITKNVDSWRIIKGVKPGIRIVTEGAFFVHAESEKRGFSTHNH